MSLFICFHSRFVTGTDLHGLGQPEGHNLWHAQLPAPLKHHIVVNVHQLACAVVKQNVVQVAVP